MALTGIQILGMLPKTNCGECNIPTCLAFAMKVAAGQTEIEECPYVSDEAKETIGAANAPPIRTVKIGAGDAEFIAGGETCLYRHDKRFENQTGLAVLISTDEDAAEVDAKLKRANDIVIERVGVMMCNNLVAVKDAGGGDLAAMAKKVMEAAPQQAIILMSDNVDSLKAGAEACGDNKPLLYGATADNVDDFAALAKDTGCAIGVKGKNMDDLV
ncbi:MAG: acetyl-CoA decarbonylase/synthase complex subunit gamma, partial [Deltaproteobacteria bacterium]|nr:acetyl-CoA decarbonylase/synthase complex subunit gamma [Deltaproteobacteria bacterium]